MRLQPTEFTKMATAMILGRYVAATGVKLTDFSSQLKSLAIIGLPIALIALQPDFGSIIIFAALIIPLYREGFPSIYLIIGISVSIFFILTLLIPRTELLIGIAALGLILVILLQNRKWIFSILFVLAIIVGFIFATDYLLNEVAKPYSKARVEAIFKPELVDPQAEGWNLNNQK